jgi:N-acetylglucosamine kinase-like BadF-type ATPase
MNKPGFRERMVIGIDGGGSKTTVKIARSEQDGRLSVLGSGHSGPSNYVLAGAEISVASLNQGLSGALEQAQVTARQLECSVLALAGSSAEDVRQQISDWAASRGLMEKVEIVHDIVPVLAAGTDHGWGIALIVGTGSVAMGVNEAGNKVIKGGWGHYFGDKPSGYALGKDALAAVVEAADDMGPETLLSQMVLEKLGVVEPREMIKEITSRGDMQRSVAALAPVVCAAADLQDAVACRIVAAAVTDAVKLVSAVVKGMTLTQPYPLALAGGVVCHSESFRTQLTAQLNLLDPAPASVRVVSEPVMGCLQIAQKRVLTVNS